MGNYLFIHGGWHGAWCWNRLVPLLTKRGHNVIALDLPSHGRDRTPTAKVTMTDYVNAVVAQLDALSGPAVLVGHSSGGAVATQVAEERPEKVSCVVYLAAFILQNGESIMSIIQQAHESVLLKNLVPSPEQNELNVSDGALRECFYGNCSEEDLALAKFCLVPQPLAPAVTPVAITDKNYGRVRRVYIETLRDRAIPNATQKQMYSRLPCEKVFSLDTDHSPFFSAPTQLAEQLAAI